MLVYKGRHGLCYLPIKPSLLFGPLVYDVSSCLDIQLAETGHFSFGLCHSLLQAFMLLLLMFGLGNVYLWHFSCECRWSILMLHFQEFMEIFLSLLRSYVVNCSGGKVLVFLCYSIYSDGLTMFMSICLSWLLQILIIVVMHVRRVCGIISNCFILALMFSLAYRYPLRQYHL